MNNLINLVQWTSLDENDSKLTPQAQRHAQELRYKERLKTREQIDAEQQKVAVQGFKARKKAAVNE
jgi:hypothetical protein